jgi:apolipoprotein D and lipocalin family protein
MKNLKIAIFSILFLFQLNAPALASEATENLPPVTTVKELDINKYLGTWYEIASFPQRFQKDCTGTTATYSLRDDGKISVLNKCFKKALNGPESTANGKAWVPNPSEPGQLKVQFFWPFSGDYWVIALDKDYQWVVVGSPNRKYLWILARTPSIKDSLYSELTKMAELQFFDLTKLNKTLQNDG